MERKALEHAQVIKQVSGYGADEWEVFTREWQQGFPKCLSAISLSVCRVL